MNDDQCLAIIDLMDKQKIFLLNDKNIHCLRRYIWSQ